MCGENSALRADITVGAPVCQQRYCMHCCICFSPLAQSAERYQSMLISEVRGPNEKVPAFRDAAPLCAFMA